MERETIGGARGLALAFAAAALVALVTITLVERPALAAFPGHNGRIAFNSDRDGDPEIYTMRADGTGVRQLTHNDASDFKNSYSPNGKQIAFNSDRDGDFEIFVMRA